MKVIRYNGCSKYRSRNEYKDKGAFHHDVIAQHQSTC